MRNSWRAVDPLREVPANRPVQSAMLKNWKATQNTNRTEPRTETR